MMLRVIITYVERHNELNSVKQPVTIPKPLLTHFYEFKVGRQPKGAAVASQIRSKCYRAISCRFDLLQDKKLQKQEMLNAIAKHFEDNVESVALVRSPSRGYSTSARASVRALLR